MSAPGPRHRAVEAIERYLHDEEFYDGAALARAIVLRLEAAGLAIHDAPPPSPTGFCDTHGAPQPCHGCAGDAKAKPDNPKD